MAKATKNFDVKKSYRWLKRTRVTVLNGETPSVKSFGFASSLGEGALLRRETFPSPQKAPPLGELSSERETEGVSINHKNHLQHAKAIADGSFCVRYSRLHRFFHA